MGKDLISEMIQKTIMLKGDVNYVAKDCSEVRLLPTVGAVGFSHCTLEEGKTSSPITHRHVEEFWYALEGKGEVWRNASGAKEAFHVNVGTSLTIPPRTAFQFRNTGTDPLRILIVTTPPWPGPQEAEEAVDPWLPTVTPGAEQADEGKGRGEP